ncbi:hypothetical protein DEJ38_02120 [Kocuria rosea]|nr:hypothetical protein DEJ38_02120 [Kocuria rosea]
MPRRRCPARPARRPHRHPAGRCRSARSPPPGRSCPGGCRRSWCRPRSPPRPRGRPRPERLRPGPR